MDYKITSIATCPSCSGKKKSKRIKTLAESFARIKSSPATDLPDIYQVYTFRSGWERNFARWLHFVKDVEFEYEVPRCKFIFPGFKNAPHVYLCDFYVPSEDRFYEVKGIFLGKDKLKIKRLKKLHPESFNKLSVVISNKNKKAKKFYDLLKVPVLYIEDILDTLDKNNIYHE